MLYQKEEINTTVEWFCWHREFMTDDKSILQINEES